MSYGGHLSYRLVYNNLSNAAHNTMRPLKSKGVHCIKIRVISQVNTPLPSPGRGRFVCALWVRCRTPTAHRSARKTVRWTVFRSAGTPAISTTSSQASYRLRRLFLQKSPRAHSAAPPFPTKSRCAIFCGGPVFRLPVGGVYLALISPRSPPRVPVFKL